MRHGTHGAYAARMCSSSVSTRRSYASRFASLLVLLSASLVACGGATDDPSAPGTAPQSPGPGEPQVKSGGDAVEYFHSGIANLGVDHQRRVFAIVSHARGSDASARVCGTLPARGDVVAPGAAMTIPSGLLYPTGSGGGVATSSVTVASVDDKGLVVHVTLKNGSSYDETWLRGLGTECAGDCIPAVTTCRAAP